MIYLNALYLGIIEGITEFLPVSSTAHLRLAEQYLFNISMEDPFWKMFSIVIQLGAILCLPTYFHREILRLLRSFPNGYSHSRASVPSVGDLGGKLDLTTVGTEGRYTLLTHPLSLVMIAFVCTAIPAFVLKKVISANLENLYVIGGALLIGGAVMWAVDALFTRPRVNKIDEVSLPQAVWIGLVQLLAAVFPGASRSMTTIAAGQTAGLSRSAALEFSFFLSMPTMAVATLYDLYKTLKPGKDATMGQVHMTAQNWIALLIGMVVSYVVALVVVAWFMGWVRKRGFMPFAIYRILLGLIVLISLHYRNV